MKKILVLLTLVLFCPGLVLPGFAAENAPAATPLRAAIFVQNRVGDEFAGKLDVLNDLLTTRLTEKGFSVIDRSVVLAKFREARNLEPALQRDVRAIENAVGGAEAAAGLESVLDGAASQRIAQMIGADYLIVASLTSFGKETRTFQGEGTIYKTGNASDTFTLRIALKVLEGNSGGTIYGDLVSVAERVAVVERLKIESSEIVNKLLDAGALKAAENIGDKIQKIRDIPLKSASVVEFSVASNVDGASVELDGAAIGSTPGHFSAQPGLHQLKISKEWLTTWERTVNIFAGQTMNVTLELSAEGMQRYSTLERLKSELARKKMRTEMEGKEREAGIEIRKEQSGADAYSKKAIADAYLKKEIAEAEARKAAVDAETEAKKAAADAEAKKAAAEAEAKKNSADAETKKAAADAETKKAAPDGEKTKQEVGTEPIEVVPAAATDK